MHIFDETKAKPYAPRGAVRIGTLICAPATYTTAWGDQTLPAFHMRFNEPDTEAAKANPYYGCDLDKFKDTYTDGPTPGTYVKRAGVMAYQATEDVTVATLEGPAYAPAGAWVIRNPGGEVYVNSPDIFAATYVPA